MQVEERPKQGSDTDSASVQRVEELIRVVLAQEGYAEAFAWLMQRHERSLLYYLRRFIPDADKALDMHQEVWLAVFRGLPGLRIPQAFRGWLYRLAHDKAARFIDEEIREAKAKESIEACGEPAPDLGETDAQAVHLALNTLSAPHREVLTLHYLHDLSLEEIAVACRLPVGTVKSRLHYARLALRLRLEGREP